MEQRYCKYCGKLMNQFDSYGNEVWNCPDDCDFEKACEEITKEADIAVYEALEMLDQLDEPVGMVGFSDDEISFLDFVFEIDSSETYLKDVEPSSNNQFCNRNIDPNENSVINILINKYSQHHTYIHDPESPLNYVFYALENGADIDDKSIKWLGNHHLYDILCHVLHAKFIKNGNLWDLAKACSAFRKCKNAGIVIDITKDIIITKYINHLDLIEFSAILTTRGGAFRDLREYDCSINCGLEAIEYCDTRPYPFNLMGGICIDLGKYNEAYRYFEEASMRSSNTKHLDMQIKSEFNNAPYSKQESIANFLISKDPDRFSWANRTLY